jgi:uncharacterized integral membrane protein
MTTETPAPTKRAIALGISAAVVQWSIIVAGVILFLLLVFAVMPVLGG